MIEFTEITEDNLPKLEVPVILAWKKNPFSKVDSTAPFVGLMAYKRTDYEDGWLWDGGEGFEESMDWDDKHKPTHWAYYPEFKVKS